MKPKRKRRSVADNTLRNTPKVASTFEEVSADLKKAGWGKDMLTQEIEKAFCNIGV